MADTVETSDPTARRAESIRSGFAWYLSDNEIATRLGVHRTTVRRWVREGRFPKPVKLGPNCTRWKLTDIEEFESGVAA